MVVYLINTCWARCFLVIWSTSVKKIYQNSKHIKKKTTTHLFNLIFSGNLQDKYVYSKEKSLRITKIWVFMRGNINGTLHIQWHQSCVISWISFSCVNPLFKDHLRCWNEKPEHWNLYLMEIMWLCIIQTILKLLDE